VIIFVALSLLSALALSASPIGLNGSPKVVYGGRTSFPSEIFLCVAAAVFLRDRQKTLLVNALITAVVIPFAFAAIFTTFQDAVAIAHQEQGRQQILQRVLANNGQSITFPKFFLERFGYIEETNDHNLFISDLTLDRSSIHNRCFADMVGLKSSQAVLAPVVFADDFLTPPETSTSSTQMPQFRAAVHDGKLLYVANGTSCDLYPNKATIYVHVQPAKIKSLKPSLRKDGFENLDFDFDKSKEATCLAPNGEVDSKCCALYTLLPNYKIVSITTGQYDAPTGHQFWEQLITRPRSGG
jgi:hypothetical protein